MEGLVNVELGNVGLDLWRATAYFDLVTNLDTHQVLTEFQRSRIGFSGVRDHVGNVGRHDV